MIDDCHNRWDNHANQWFTMIGTANPCKSPLQWFIFFFIGKVFPSEDETGEVFDNRNLMDLKEGKCDLGNDPERLSTLKIRNSLCPPHLKSSYPAETQFFPPEAKEEDIKVKNHF